MSKKTQSTTQIGDKLLTAEEQPICQKIAAMELGLTSQRAAALIKLDEGLTQAQTSELTGLTLGQIQYLISTFQQKRLAIFSEDVLAGLEPPEQGLTEEITKVSEVVDEDKKKTKKDKKEKSKKIKSKEKTKKKTKKDKKAKKSKASKKSGKKKSKAGKKKK